MMYGICGALGLLDQGSSQVTSMAQSCRMGKMVRGKAGRGKCWESVLYKHLGAQFAGRHDRTAGSRIHLQQCASFLQFITVSDRDGLYPRLCSNS